MSIFSMAVLKSHVRFADRLLEGVEVDDNEVDGIDVVCLGLGAMFPVVAPGRAVRRGPWDEVF